MELVAQLIRDGGSN